MREISEYDSVSTCSHIKKIATFQTLKSEIDELTEMVDFGEFRSLSLESLYVVTSRQCVCSVYGENKSGSSVNELRYS